MKLIGKLRNRWAAFVHDLLMIPLAWMSAYWVRFNLESVPQPYFDTALALMPVVLVVQSAAFWYLDLYRGLWRFASIPDLIRIIQAIIVGASLSAVALFLLTRMEHVPRSTFPVYGITLLVFLAGPRLTYRWLKDHKIRCREGQKVLIVGAGLAGETLARDLMREPNQSYELVGFVDDDPVKKGKDLHGCRVLGTCQELERITADQAVDLILIALPSASSKHMRRVVELCSKTGVPYRTLPCLHDLVSGRASLKALRDVSIEDLLGREPVSLDWCSIQQGLAGQTVMVTGGGGSIGSELCRQVARLGPELLIIFERCEFNLYSIDRELRQIYPDLALHSQLGDVCDSGAVRKVMSTWQPDVVFHAAAYKHVPLLESQVRETVRNNVIGTRNVALAAHELGCGSFVLISTDKAVNPTNVMGASKRLAEILCENLDARSETRFITVRFGNVLGSAGSVVPLFQQQIEAGGPVTVTHPEMSRYFMTIPEACQLILQAAALGRGGEIFVLDMGESVNIRHLAEQMIRLAGKIPGVDIDIVFTGLRPGEKLVEELFYENENLVPTEHEKMLLARYRPVDWKAFHANLTEMHRACERYDERRLLVLLSAMIPKFRSGPRQEQPAEVIPLERAKA
jgi:Predicted nucleoside-diphosphate sugar epimerases